MLAMAWTTVLVADPQNLIAESLAGVLERYPDFFVRQETVISASDAIKVAKEWQPDVVLLEFWMGDMEAPAAIKRILKVSKKSKILILSWFYSAEQIQKCLDAGAVGFLPKSIKVDQLAEAIRVAHAGHVPVFAEQLKELVGKLAVREGALKSVTDRLATLTPRELEVLQVLAGGQSLEEVARVLMVSRSTLKIHINSILRKTGTRKHAEAVAIALRSGWIQL